MPIAPTVHMNGDTRETLFNSYMHAYGAIVAAVEAVAASYPNSRNFVPQGDDAVLAAMAEHHDRLKRLRSIGLELSDIAMAIQDQRVK